MKDEALKLALEALLINCGGNTEGIGKEAIAACEQALAAQRQWVGLTPECRKQLIQEGWSEYIAGIDDGKTFGEWMSVATEAKLKERNV
jgi:hypothetical protein